MQNILIDSIKDDTILFTVEQREENYAFAGRLLSFKTIKVVNNFLSISTKEWPRFYKEMNKQSAIYNLKFKSPKLFNTIRNIEETVPYAITKNERFILIRCELGSNVSIWCIQNNVIIPGVIKRDYQTHTNVEMPMTEAYRLIDIISEIRAIGVKFTIDENVLKYATEQNIQRNTLDKIALATDTEYPDVLNTITLRPFQKVGATFIEATGGRAIVCDEMGLGKSAQFLAYVAKNNLSAVIVVPASLKINWVRYIKQYLNEDAYVCSGRQPTGVDFDFIMNKKYKFVIINYDILGSNIESKDKQGFFTQIYPWAILINASGYDCIGLDEFHKIKNVDAKRTQAAITLTAKHIVGLSGTPILNRPQEAWPILHLLDKETFPNYGRFENQYGAKNGYVRNLKELQSLLKTRMIRRTKKDVMKELPAILRVNEFVELNDADKKRYQKVLTGIYESLSGNRFDVQNLLVQIMRLKQICAQAKMEATAEHAQELNESMEGDYKKVIIFSQFVECVTFIKNYLGNECVSFTGADGGDYRMAQCDAFQNDEKIKYLVCTTQVAAEGLNLTKAGAVVFNDLMWTPAAHQQAEGRAYGRLNDAHAISSYYMIVANSIEDFIQSLLASKLAVIEAVVDGTNSIRANESMFNEVLEYLKNGG